jgi:LXG domain of WXG superfamily/DNase/tRNase domain of colicin-like bacteriocin
MSEVNELLTTYSNFANEAITQLTELQQSIEQFQQLEGFTGQAAASAKAYMGEVHDTIIQNFILLIANIEVTFKNMVQEFESSVDNNKEAIIRTDHFYDLKDTFRQHNHHFLDIHHDLLATIQKVSDIVSLSQPNPARVEEMYYNVNVEISNRDLDVEAFDSMNRDKMDANFDLLNSITNAMNQIKSSISTPSGIKYNVGEITSSSWGGKLFDAEARASSQLIEQLEISERNAELAKANEPEKSFIEKIGKGIWDGAGQAIGDTFEGIVALGDWETWENIGHAVTNLDETIPNMWHALSESFKRDIINGDAESRAKWLSYGVVQGTLGVLGDKGISKVGTAAKGLSATADMASVANRFNTGNRLAFAGIDSYNFGWGREALKDRLLPFQYTKVERVDGSGLTQSKVEKVDGGTKGTVKSGRLDVKDFTKEILKTKPMNSPIPEKWYKKGGDISIDDNGTWTYTNKSGISVSYPNGYPDFRPYMHPNVEPVTIEVHSPKNNPKDFENANKEAKLTKDTDPPIIDIRKPPEGYTWHHHEDGKTMMLVDEDIHREFRHIGGQSKVNGKNQ